MPGGGRIALNKLLWQPLPGGRLGARFEVSSASAVGLRAGLAFKSNGRVKSLGLYASDQWTIQRLTLNLGVRFDHFNVGTLPIDIPAGQPGDISIALHIAEPVGPLLDGAWRPPSITPVTTSIRGCRTQKAASRRPSWRKSRKIGRAHV